MPRPRIVCHRWNPFVLAVLAVAGSAVGGCSGADDTQESWPEAPPPSSQDGLSGCKGKASSSIPSSGVYVLTTFGGPDEPQPLACGSHSKSGSWYYAASRQRYGCGKHVRITANGKCAVARTDDYGPDVCVEQAAGYPVMDVSPLVSKHLFGKSSLGWSDKKKVHVELVSTSTPLGPCTTAGGGGSGGTGGSSGGTGGSSGGAGGATGGSGGSGGATPTNGSCAGSCGSTSPAPGSNPACYCDSACTGYGDCCSDFSSVCSTSGSGGTPCSSDGQCNPGNDGSGLICVGGQCVPGCKASYHCPGVKVCKNGQCV